MLPAFERAARSGDAKAVLDLLAQGVDVDSPDSHGQTALMLAAHAGHIELVALLLSKQAKLDVTAKHGLSALMLAIVAGYEDTALTLVRAGANLALQGTGAPGFAGKTARDLAGEMGMSDLVREMAGRDSFTQFEYDGWQRVANRYHAAWGALTSLYIPALLDAVQAGRGARLLDVACGPGYCAEQALERGAEPTGVDFSPEMIRLARARNARIAYFTGDAQALAFDDGSFDAVVMNFGALHLARPEAAFAEARRVLRRGGWYGFTTWAGPEQSPGARVVEEAIKAHWDPDIGLPKGPDYFGFGRPETCCATFAPLGFDPASLVFRTVTADWRVPGPEFVFEAERDAGVRMAAVLAAQTPAVQARIRAALEAGLQPFADGRGFCIPYAAHVIALCAA